MGNAKRDRPIYRKLRGYAFDPSLSLLIDTVHINTIVYQVRWEDDLNPGPAGEYVEVIDHDPTTGHFYSPVDLDDRYILADDGLAPSESNPQFHQQMVYAVAMATIQNFEKALGRKILWASRLLADRRKYEEYVGKLRIYPHALRDANAYYSPNKKAVLFGYFASTPAKATLQMPGSIVFTCLSHDIIAHEVTHVVLDGLHRNYNRPTNPDVLAFHEAFADIVALFQHFSFPEVLRHQIASTKGDLEKQNLLGQLAQQFGVAIGQYGSLRDALGSVDEETGEWQPRRPDPRDYERSKEPHHRGSILVAAVFEAFIAIYKRRVADLLRIASGGTGILPAGELHPDLVNRMADEAAKTAEHVLNMCIRAIDYCAPVDITFGDYLRAIITADCDVVDNDSRHYRLAFIDAFRRRGIYPEGIKALSVESLRHPRQWDDLQGDTRSLLGIIGKFLREYRERHLYKTDRQEIYELSREFMGGSRETRGLHQRLIGRFDNSYEFERLTGLVFNGDWRAFGVPGSGARQGNPSFQVLNLRLVSRVGPDSDQINQIVFSLLQRMGVIYDENGKFKGYYTPGSEAPPAGGFEVMGGCTLIFDLDSVELKYAISKPLLKPAALDQCRHEPNVARFDQQRTFEHEVLPLSMSEVSHYFEGGLDARLGEPFALLHTSGGREDA